MSILADLFVAYAQAKNYSGSGDWLDESGNGHDATPQGSPTFGGDHFTLNGTSQYFTVADHADLNFADGEPFTAMLVLSAPHQTSGRLISKRVLSPAKAYEFMYESAGAGEQLNVFFHDGTDLLNVDNIGTVPASTRYVATMRVKRDATDYLVYVNGVAQGTQQNTSSLDDLSNAVDLHIGRAAFGAQEFLEGDIYAWGLARSALTDTQIVQAGESLSGETGRRLLLLGAG